VRKRLPPSPRSTAVQVLVAGLVLLGTALVALGFKESADPRFAFEGASVSGEAHTALTDIVYAEGFEKGMNVWLLDTGAAAKRIEALPWVDTAIVSRAWPNRVSVRVTERQAAVRVRLSSASAEEPMPAEALIDASGRILAISAVGQSDPKEAQAAALPLISLEPSPSALTPGGQMPGDDYQLAYDALVQLRALGLRVSEVDLKPATGITVTSDDGLRAILGTEDDLAKKVTLFKAIVPKIAAPENVVYVDLRSVRAPTVLYR
jgi:cell division protein FtsQ